MFHLRIAMTALHSLRQNLARSMLATLGVIIGVGAVVCAISILEGAQSEILDEFESLGADQVIVFNGSERGQHRTAVSSSLLPEDADLIKKENPELIVATSPQFSQFAQVKNYEKNVATGVLGSTEAYAPMNNYLVTEGRFITREDVRGGAMVCVLGYKVAEDLFGALPAVDKHVKIDGKSFIVVGVMEEKGTLGFTEVDSQVIIPLSTAMGRMFGSRHLSMMVVQCTDTQHLPACVEAVKKTLRASHRIKAGDDADFVVFTQERFKDTFAQASRIFAVVLYSIACISLVVGGIGIMNIMLVSVTERTREIGVRIAVGARRMDIAKQFLIEASVISLLGGAVGVVVGWAIASFLGEFLQVFQSYTPPMSIVLALLLAGVVGIASGLYPAVRAARLDPIRSLRYE